MKIIAVGVTLIAIAVLIALAAIGNRPSKPKNATSANAKRADSESQTKVERTGSKRYRTEDFPIRSARDFLFYSTSYNWEAAGSYVTSIDAKGNVIHVTPDRIDTPTGFRVEWRRGSFRLTPQELKAFKDLLIEIRFPELSDEYIDTAWADGWQSIDTVIAGGKRKSVFTKNWAPKEIERLNDWLREHISRAPDRQPEDYTVISYEEAERYWKEKP